MTEEIEIDAADMEKQFMFGLRLATAAQLAQGMLAGGCALHPTMLDDAIKYANLLIEKCST